MINWSSLSGHRNNVTISTSEAPNSANGQPLPPGDIQMNSSSSMLTGRKERYPKAKGKGIKKQCRSRVTGGEESLEELTVEQSGKKLTDQINRRINTVKAIYGDWLLAGKISKFPEVLATVKQIEEKWPLLFNLQKIKENRKEILTEFKANRLTEVEAKQKLLEGKQMLSHIDIQLQELNKANNLDTIFVDNQEYDVETIKNKFYSEVPYMKEVAETDGHESLPTFETLSSTFGDWDFPFCGTDKGLVPLGDTITIGMLQRGGSEVSEAQYNTNAPPLSHSDDQMNLMLSGSNKRDGKLVLGKLSEAGGQGTEINDVATIVDQDHGSLLAREMLKRNYSSWHFKLFNKDNNNVEVSHFHGLQQALDKTRNGETPDYLKPIAIRIEMDRGKATKYGHKNIEVLMCAAIKEMEEWRTPKDSGCDQLKKWAATLNMGKEQGFEVKFADDMLMNKCLACFAYSMIFGEDGSAHKVASGSV